jgi:hypothetical protein
MKHLALILGGVSIAVAAFAPTTAAAQSVARHQISHGTAACQAALPVSDAHLRKRPLAIANEGTRTAFVTCDTDSIDPNGAGFEAITVLFVNRAAEPGLSVACTLVDGIGAAAVYIPQSSRRMKVGENAVVQWTRASKGGRAFAAPAVSCAVPAGMDLVLTDFAVAQELGAYQR